MGPVHTILPAADCMHATYEAPLTHMPTAPLARHTRHVKPGVPCNTVAQQSLVAVTRCSGHNPQPAHLIPSVDHTEVGLELLTMQRDSVHLTSKQHNSNTTAGQQHPQSAEPLEHTVM